VCKRLARRLRELGLESLEEYRALLENDRLEWTVLDGLCRITISRFFRDRNVFAHLATEVWPRRAEEARGNAQRPRGVERWTEGGSEERMPGRLGGDLAGGETMPPPEAPIAQIRCWTAGCASGEEPYSLTMLWELELRKRFADVSLSVLATDSSPTMIERARDGRYERGSLREVPSAWIDAAFRSEGGLLVLLDPFRTPVRFVLQDIRRDMPAEAFDVVFCRNLVFTYYETALQGELLAGILERLQPEGALVLGGHERLPPGDWGVEAHPTLPVFRKA
jgi:chemotaxis protein methyltransferase CheR